MFLSKNFIESQVFTFFYFLPVFSPWVVLRLEHVGQDFHQQTDEQTSKQQVLNVLSMTIEEKKLY